ncbi:MAG: GTP-binding protein [Alphaproteobacteria bacterium]|jgi:GTP-binding protein
MSSTTLSKKALPRVVIAGRPNVGKSTLFNRLSGRKDAIVDAQSGVTRDSRLVESALDDLAFDLVDTAGIELGEEGIASRLNVLAEDAVKQSDLVLFLVDGRAGITSVDAELAKRVRSFGRPVIVVVNKIDVHISDDTMYEAYSLGFDAAIGISSAHGMGFNELTDAIRPYIEKRTVELAAEAVDEKEDERFVLPLAIIGRPNAGKSTLVNQLLKSNRMLTGPEAGLTRESVGSLWEVDGRLIELVDTPGIRRKGRVSEDLEKMSVTHAMNAMAKSEAVLLMLDATLPFEKQDVTLASIAVDRGKPLVIGLNKWDLVEDKDEYIAEIKFRLEHSFSQVKGVPFVTMSALKDKGVEKILPTVLGLHKKWQTRLTTSQLNKFLEGMLVANPPPMRRNRRMKIKYMSQIASEPPTFAIFCNMPDELQSSYVRYLQNGLREAFDLYGIALILKPMGSDNPYAKKHP